LTDNRLLGIHKRLDAWPPAVHRALDEEWPSLTEEKRNALFAQVRAMPSA
jgi:hypothetical protein